VIRNRYRAAQTVTPRFAHYSRLFFLTVYAGAPMGFAALALGLMRAKLL
jgi:hypothetical protein